MPIKVNDTDDAVYRELVGVERGKEQEKGKEREEKRGQVLVSIDINHTTFNATRKSTSAASRQWTVRRTMGVIVSWFQIFLCCWSTSMELAACINPSCGLYRTFLMPSKN